MKPFYSSSSYLNGLGRISIFIKKTIQFLLLAVLFAFNPGALSACDTSGFQIDSYNDNGDGTFTVTMTIMVAGSFTTVCGSTWGFFWNVDTDILSVSPGSLTSINGTMLSPVITGTTVTWGDPNGGFPTIPFVDAEAGSNTADESFTVSIVLDGQATMWNGGGQEANTCPNGGCAADPAQYEGEFPCFLPDIQALPYLPALPCPGDNVTLSVMSIPAYLTDDVIWEPGGLSGETVIVNVTETTTYTATASNICGEISIDITVEITPYPTIEALDENIVACENFPVILEVSPMYEVIVTWEPTGGAGNIQIVTPTSSPSLYTATASNHCGEADVDILVTTTPPPTVNIINGNQTICLGDSVLLKSDTSHTDQIQWLPSGSNNENLLVFPDSTTEYIVIASSNCGADIDTVTVVVASGVTNNIQLEACEGGTVLYNSIPLAAGTESTFTFPNFVGCDSVVVVTVGTLPTYAIPVQLEACENETVIYNGETLSPGETREFPFQTIAGCDSIITVTVQELPTYTSDLELPACANSFTFYQGTQMFPGDEMDFTLSAINGCDSVVTVKINGLPIYDFDVMLETCTGTTIPYLGMNLTPGSTTEFNLTTASGCDSTVTVFVEELAILTDEVTFEACTGSTIPYDGVQLPPGTVQDFTFTTAVGCDSIVTVTVNEVTAIEQDEALSACAGTSAIFDGVPVAAGTTINFNYTTAQGCDSIVTVEVAELPIYNLPLTLQACTGSSIPYNGMDLDAGTTTNVTLMTMSGCDSIMAVTVEGIDEVTASTTLPACSGGSVTFNGVTLDAGTMMDFTFVSSIGCDSILTVTVGDFPTYNEPLTLQACTGTTVEFQGVPLPPNTTVEFTLSTINGCDSVIAVTVDEVETIETDLDFETCANTFINYNGTMLPPGTQDDFTFTSVNGCDSVVTVTVGLADEITGNEVLDACANSTVMYNGTALDPGTVNEFTLQTLAGCDSLVSVVVFELDTFASPLTLLACPNGTVDYNGMTLVPNTMTDFTLTAITNGCDSVVTVGVEELPTFASPLTLHACPNGTVMYNGMALAPNTTTDFTLTAISNGCDSIVSVTVDELPTFATPLTLQACTGSTVPYNGQQLSPGTVQDFTFPSVLNGCDSTVTVTVEEVVALTGDLELEACMGETVPFMGQDLLAGSVTDFDLTSVQGCDSILTVTVMELQPQTGMFETATCSGETFNYNGEILQPNTITDITITASNGCDSVVTVRVDELLATTSAVSLQGCPTETLLFNGTEITPGTSMDFTFTNAAGCDSTVTVTGLDPLPSIETEEVLEVCEGESVLIFGVPISDAGIYSETYISLNGCDSIHSVTLDVADDLGVAFDNNLSINLGESIVLNPIIASTANLMYSWAPDSTLSCFDCANPIASPLYTTSYFVTVTDDKGCNASSDVLLLVRKDRGVYIPNSFSPNSDGINDVFMIFSDPNTVATVRSFQVYSRWGESVFETYNFPTNDPTYGWDGKYRDEFMNPAVYAYFVEVEFVDGVVTLFKGDVQLVR